MLMGHSKSIFKLQKASLTTSFKSSILSFPHQMSVEDPKLRNYLFESTKEQVIKTKTKMKTHFLL